MEFYETDEGRPAMREIPPMVEELLLRVPHCVDLEKSAVEDRLFPSPTDDPMASELAADWQAYVAPELHELFLTNRQVVEADLRTMRQEDEGACLEISRKHAEAWLNVLNQARLSLVAAHQFSEEEMDHDRGVEIANERDLALFQIHFYGMVQHWLLDLLDED